MSKVQYKLKGASIVADCGVSVDEFDKVIFNDPMAFAPQLAGAYAAGDNPYFSIQGLNAANGDVTLDSGGGYKITVTTTAHDEVALLLNTDATNYAPTVDDEPSYVVKFKTDADDATYTQILVGLGSDDDGDAPFDGGGSPGGELDPNAAGVEQLAAFSFDTDDSDTTFQLDIIDDGGTISSVDTGVAFTADTNYLASVRYDESNHVVASLIDLDNGDEFHYRTDTAQSGTTNLIGPVCGLSALSTATRDLFVRKHVFSGNHG